MRYLATALVLSLGFTGLSYGALDAGVSAGINVSGDKDVNFSLFYEKLSPHGKWMEVKDYGWVWQPTVAVETANWRPYMNEGHWVNTDYGWYWVSDYEWGWAPFHYGRWTIIDDGKWAWIPGETWGPAWVTWRESDRYYGWAPLPPEVVFQPGVGLEFHGKHIEANVDFGLRADFFTFVPADHFLAENVATVAIPPAQVTTVYRETKIVNNSFTVNNNRIVDRGIDPQRVSQVTKQQVKTVNVTDSNTPVSGREALKGNELHAFKPEVKKDGAKTPKDFQQNADKGGATEKSGAAAKSKEEHPVNTSVQNRNTNNQQSTSPAQQPSTNKAQTPAQAQPKAENRQELNKSQAPAQKPTEPKAQERQELNKNQPATKPQEQNERRTEANPAKDLNRPEAAQQRKDLSAPSAPSAPKAQEPAKSSSDALKAEHDPKAERPINTSAEPRRSERAEPSNRAPAPAPKTAEPARAAQERHEAAPRATEEMKERTDTSATKHDTEVKKDQPIR